MPPKPKAVVKPKAATKPKPKPKAAPKPKAKALTKPKQKGGALPSIFERNGQTARPTSHSLPIHRSVAPATALYTRISTRAPGMNAASVYGRDYKLGGSIAYPKFMETD